MIAPDKPFLRPVDKRWIPSEMTVAPVLDAAAPGDRIDPYYALLINPFYPKDANASFGKHVLTPTLALTSFAAATPAHWRVEYFDENLHASIWRRRPQDWQAVPLYLAMSYLYKRSNRFWHLLIKHDLVNPVWKPLVEMTRWRHVRYRRRLAQREMA